jgi:hypothetical protein
MHECRLVEKRKHAVKVLEEVFHQRNTLVLGRERSEDTSAEEVSEYFWLPVHPLVLVYGGVRYHFLK